MEQTGKQVRVEKELRWGMGTILGDPRGPSSTDSKKSRLKGGNDGGVRGRFNPTINQSEKTIPFIEWKKGADNRMGWGGQD